MTIERMAELVQVRLLELGVNAADCTADVERERAYVLAFCAAEELDDELCNVVVELAAAAILQQEAVRVGGKEAKSLTMGDVSMSIARSGAASQEALAEAIFRRAIERLAARRGIRW